MAKADAWDAPASVSGADTPGPAIPLPIIFLGPSLPVAEARRTLPAAEYRPPIRRGDLDEIGRGAVVGIIDGVFAQTLAISPGEVREAIARGARIFGAASMGALRAAEVPEVEGLGRIFDMYRSGLIERDDEVALIFRPDTYQPLSVPLINLRYAVERLVRSATISRETGESLVEAAAGLNYAERSFDAILRRAGLAGNHDSMDLVRLLAGFDLKRDDAQFLLETIAALDPCDLESGEEPAQDPGASSLSPDHARVRPSEPADAPILVWESGDEVQLDDLLHFLMLTGKFEQIARGALGRFAIANRPLRLPEAALPAADADDPQAVLDATRLVWGWESPEEAHVTLRDLGLGLRDLGPSLEAECAARRLPGLAFASRSAMIAKAIRTALWLDDLTLQREVMRLGALNYFAALSGTDEPSEEWTDGARRTVARLRAAMQWQVVVRDMASLGVAGHELDGMTERLARARRAAAPVVAALDRRSQPRGITPRRALWAAAGMEFGDSPKAHDTDRFARPTAEAGGLARAIAKRIGIRRIGLIGELDTLGVHVAQAFGERSGWSVSFSSGKSETAEGARLGSIMEEVEIHAQDAFRPRISALAPYAPSAPIFTDPQELGLPYDSRYRVDTELEWSDCVDLVSARTMLVPAASLVGERLPNDIYYSPRLGGKIFSSSGLGSGFSLAEAVVHAAAELIERHAVRLAELEIDNPGGVGIRQFWFVDHDSLPETPRRVVARYQAAGMTVRILDITPDIKVPTFYVRVFDDPFVAQASMSSDGFACHPDPAVAVTMALLEAAQTKAGMIAGGREDFSLQARSLGRHERPRTLVPDSQTFWFCNDQPERPLSDTSGFVSRDISEELEWMVDRVVDAGYPHFLVRDLSCERIAPAHAVRAILPGTETTNPLHTGARARATLIRDLLPRPAC